MECVCIRDREMEMSIVLVFGWDEKFLCVYLTISLRLNCKIIMLLNSIDG